MRYVGVDTGGTFTDFLTLEGGQATVRKLPSTPDDPARVILERLSDGDGPFDLVHGSTVATNTLLERRGARCAMVVTAGFEDVIEIGRQDRPHIYDIHWRPPSPLVEPELRFGVQERIGPGGEVVTPLTSEEIERVVAAVAAAKPAAVCVCLLFSPENDTHEQALTAALEALGVPVIPSSRVHSEIREYERFSTAAISAYVAPVIDDYMQRLADGVGARRFRVMESGGGVMAWPRLRGQAVRTVLSGPAGGVVAAAAFAGGRGVVSFDMGGTSTDVALIEDGRIPVTRRFRIGQLPVAIPLVDVHTVGAGGGSEAWLDAGGALRVGPRSAGADPGPICYGRGGAVVTVTDANYFLGHLPRSTRLGGEMPLVEKGTVDAIRNLGARLGLSPVAVARGVIRVVEAEMERALRKITQERGVDPRQLALVAFGGAGSLHAVSLARALGMREVLVPPDPGVMSAAGMLMASEVETSTRAVVAPLDGGLLARLAKDAEAREAGGRRALAAGGNDGEARVVRTLCMRYLGQSHELEVDWSGDPRDVFHDEYERRYGFVERDRVIEVTAARSVVSIPSSLTLASPAADVAAAEPRRTPVLLGDDGETTSVPLLIREQLARGAEVSGPAIVEETSSTLWLPEGAHLTVADDGALRIRPDVRGR